MIRYWTDPKVQVGSRTESIEPKCLQKPHPPIYVATYREDAAAWLSAPDIETLVATAVRNHLDNREAEEYQDPTAGRQMIERIIVKPQAVEIHVVSKAGHGPDEHDQEISALRSSESGSAVVITVPWISPATVAAKGRSSFPVILSSHDHGQPRSLTHRHCQSSCLDR